MATTAPHNAAEAIRAWPQNCAIAAVTRSGVTSFAAVADARRADLADALAGPPAALRRLVCLPYELGHALEPAAGPPTAPQDPTSRERAATDPRPLVIDLNPSPLPTTTGAAAPQPIDLIQPLRPTTARERYIEAVRTVKGRIAEGDVYQVNLAHTLRARFRGSPRCLFATLLEQAEPRFATYAELPDGSVICGASPELYLAFDASTRTLSTRPMKGTRPLSDDPAELMASEKDRAELNMIVDLMRNDLGRVATPGSVRVARPRDVERHAAGQLQATATVTARLDDDRTLADAIRATFPPGSITGAPKIAAMRLIARLEDRPRGWYCGSMGVIDGDAGDAEFNVAIRTATLTPDADSTWTIDVPVGAGIVADSDPEAEWEETLLKALAFERALSSSPQ